MSGMVTDKVALENAHNGVRVNAVCPEHLDTPMLQASFVSDALLAVGGAAISG